MSSTRQEIMENDHNSSENLLGDDLIFQSFPSVLPFIEGPIEEKEFMDTGMLVEAENALPISTSSFNFSLKNSLDNILAPNQNFNHSPRASSPLFLFSHINNEVELDNESFLTSDSNMDIETDFGKYFK